jgi:hypothetical protein
MEHLIHVEAIKDLLGFRYGWANRRAQWTTGLEVKTYLYGAGEWIAEPDQIEWPEQTIVGIVTCKITRNFETGTLKACLLIPSSVPFDVSLLPTSISRRKVSIVESAFGHSVFIYFDTQSDYMPRHKDASSSGYRNLTFVRNVLFELVQIVDVVRK